MKKKTMLKILIIIILIILITIITIFNKNNNVIDTNAESLSTNKIAWGIKRNDKNEQPDVGKKNREVLEKSNGICLGSNEKKYIYLTFDEGYEAGYTEQILNTLKNNNINATFFITAHYLNTQSELVKRMIDEGHIVGNHTVNHKSMPTLSEKQIKDEVMDLHIAIFEKFNYEMKFIRPPKGEFSEKSLSITNSLGYRTVMWSFAYEDWNENNQPSEEKAQQKIISNLHNGEIMLLHGNSKTNTNILDEIIKECINKGYEFKSLNDFYE